MQNIKINALGDACPIPVVKTKNAIAKLQEPGEICVLVDNEIAVQNLTKMAQQKKYGVTSAKLEENKFEVILRVEKIAPAAEKTAAQNSAQEFFCDCEKPAGKIVAISSNLMGEGDEILGKKLMQGFIFALTQQDILPQTILLYNGGAHLSCEASASLADLEELAARGVEILTCGTCLNHYGIADKLRVGGVTNMYEICAKMLNASSVVKP